MTGDGPGTVGMNGLGRRLIFYGAQGALIQNSGCGIMGIRGGFA